MFTDLVGGLWVKVGILVAVLAIISGAFLYVDNLTKRVAAAETESMFLSAELTASRQQVDWLKEDVENAKQFVTTLNEQLDKSREERQHMVKIFAKHDFSLLVKEKPGLITRRMQSATERVWESFQDVSRAGLGEPVP